MSKTVFYFKKLDERAMLPQQRKGDVGLDIRCLDDFEIAPGKTIKVKTGLMLAKAPESGLGAVFLKIEDRSSMALKGVFSHGGIIDPTYRGEFHVILFNSSDQPYKAKAGDKIAQGIVYPAAFNYNWTRMECVETDEVEETERGSGGFGSTGA
jgi:dUTP pyrophosphatase